MENEHPESNKEAPVSVERVIAWAEAAMRGEHSGNLNEYEDVGETVPVVGSEGESDPADGVILDMADMRRSDAEKERLRAWLKRRLGNAGTLRNYISKDSQTTVKVYNKYFGTPTNRWFVSEWVDKKTGLPSYILWGKEMYDRLLTEDGYQRLTPLQELKATFERIKGKFKGEARKQFLALV